jgi:hypothetical protein
VTVDARLSGPLLAPVTVSGTAQDPGAGIASVVVRVLDAHGEPRLRLEPIDGQGASSVSWTRTILLETPSRPGLAAQTYTVEATATDRAGNTHTCSATIAVARQLS